MLNLIMFFTFASCSLLLFPVVRYLIGKQKAISRINKYIRTEEIKEERKSSGHHDLRAGLNILSRGIGNARFLDGYKKTIQRQLLRAHILLKAEEYITVCLIMFAAAGLIIYLMTGAFLFALGAAIVGWLIPTNVVKAKIKRRIKNLNNQLGDAIVLISNSLKAGYSFFQAVDIVAKEMAGPIAEEFTLLQKEISLGSSTEKALENLVARVSSDDLELVITAVMIQRQVGGNLAEVLDNISSTIRERIRIKGEVRTITAQGRMSGLIISLLPVALGFILYVINPEHIGVLFKNPIGIAILVFSAMMELIGIYFISRIVKIEV